MKIAAIIPAYNEEEFIEKTLAAVRQIEQIGKIVVVDDGSEDSTASLVRQCEGVSLINLPRNSGKGAALNEGWLNTKADIYLFLDADLGCTASYGEQLLIPVIAGEVDMTVARFGLEQAGETAKMGFGLVRGLACLGVRCLTGEVVTSPLSGQRALTAEVLQNLGGVFPGFGVEIGLTIGALRQGFRLLEVPLPMRHRGYGRGFKGLRHRGRQFMHVVRALWRCWRKEK